MGEIMSLQFMSVYEQYKTYLEISKKKSILVILKRNLALTNLLAAQTRFWG